MNGNRLGLVIALGFLGLVAGQLAQAQPYPSLPPGMGSFGRRGPALSPYLNLRPNRASDYFLGVLPEVDRRYNTVEQRAQIIDLERRIEEPVEPASDPLTSIGKGALPPTGHPTGFVNYGNYFNIPSLPGPGARTAPFPRRLR